MKSLARSQAARRRAAAAAAVASVGAGILGTQSAEAGIVILDLTNLNGVNLTGVNAGVTAGNSKSWYYNFGVAGKLQFGVMNNVNVGYTGIKLIGIGGVAHGSAYCTPSLYAFGATINGAVSNFDASNFGCKALFKYTNAGVTAPSFDGYLGFLSSGTDGNGTDGVYGWIKATWNGTNTFQFYSAAYESTPGLAIKAGDDGSAPVPEIDPSGLASAMSLVMGSVAMLEQRRRKRAAVAAESAAVTA